MKFKAYTLKSSDNIILIGEKAVLKGHGFTSPLLYPAFAFGAFTQGRLNKEEAKILVTSPDSWMSSEWHEVDTDHLMGITLRKKIEAILDEMAQEWQEKCNHFSFVKDK